jgi:hypothetical protein
MKLRFFLAAFAASAMMATSALAGTVRLVCEQTLQPTSTFELRFEDAIVPADAVGKPAETPPLVIEPAIKGTFVWLSQRSGSFKPEEPYALNTSYTVTLAPGLKRVDGHAIEADLHETLKTPPMRLNGSNSPDYINNADAPAHPRFSLLFNVDVSPEEAASFIHYVNGNSGKIAAHVEKAEPEKHSEQYFPMWRSSDHTLRTWNERFFEKPAAATGLEQPGWKRAVPWAAEAIISGSRLRNRCRQASGISWWMRDCRQRRRGCTCRKRSGSASAWCAPSRWATSKR